MREEDRPPHGDPGLVQQCRSHDQAPVDQHDIEAHVEVEPRARRREIGSGCKAPRPRRSAADNSEFGVICRHGLEEIPERLLV